MKGAFWHDLFRQRRNNLFQAAAGYRLRSRQSEKSGKRKQRRAQSLGRGNRENNRSTQQGGAHGQPLRPAQRRFQSELHIGFESRHFGERKTTRLSRNHERTRTQFRAASSFRVEAARHNFPFRACARQRKPSDGAGRSKCLQQGYAAGCFKPRKQRGRFRKRRRFNRRPVQAGGRNFYRGRGAIRRLHRNRYAADENRPVGFPGAQGTARHSGLRLPLLQ